MLHLGFLLFFATVLANPIPQSIPHIHNLEDSVFKLPVGKGTKVYFLSNGDDNSLKQIAVKADKSNINTNVFSYAIPQADGSLNPLMITADDDTLVVTRPDGITAQVSLYRNNITQNLNVFPVFEKSSIKFKSGVNVFFNVDKPANRILTLKNLNLAVNSDRVIASSGVPGDAHPYTFFDTNAYPAEQFYSKLNIPLVNFHLSQIDKGVTYEVSFDAASKFLDDSGLIMTNGFPLNVFYSDLQYPLNTNGQQMSLRMAPYFYYTIGYNTVITVRFKGGLYQGNDFQSVATGKLTASGEITSVEISSPGPYAIQYIATRNGTAPTGPTDTPVITTTKSSGVFQLTACLFIVLISFWV